MYELDLEDAAALYAAVGAGQVTATSVVERLHQVRRDDAAAFAIERHQVTLQVRALDRDRLLADVTAVLDEHQVTVASTAVTTTRDRMAICRLGVELTGGVQLDRLLAAIRGVEDVYDAHLVTS
jgi:(p)ppGpp synthase/HD superfamily hydrolase